MDSRLKPNALFPTDIEHAAWLEFPAAGFNDPVSGVIFGKEHSPCCGVPLGGISTGCIDIDPRGVFGFSSIFNPGSNHPIEYKWRMPRKMPAVQPFLGISVGDKTWVLSTEAMADGNKVAWCTEPQMLEQRGRQVETVMLPTMHIENVHFANEIHYWGHYPVADMEFESDAPVSVGLRAWSPFIPGDAAACSVPAAVFTAYLRNTTSTSQKGTLAFSFSGPDAEEARSFEFIRENISEDIEGLFVKSFGDVQYLLGVKDEKNVRYGSGLSSTPNAWSQISTRLPEPTFRERDGLKVHQDASASAAVDFELEPGEVKAVKFLLAWYAPIVEGVKKNWENQDYVVDGTLRYRWIGSPWEGESHFFTHMYAARFGSALDVARYVVKSEENMLRRILAWQAAIYNEKELPVWLRDSLVNNLALIPETSYWFQPKSPLGDCVFPEGAFALNESPRGCPHMSCIPCDWYGNLPIVFFFPELALSNLRLFKAYQLPNGEIPFAIGRIGELPDMATPEYHWQVSLNGMCYVDMVDRVWQRTGEEEVLKEFYESVKATNTFTMNLHKGPGAPISMPDVGGMEWFEFGDWAGMASHMGGLRLAMLCMVERMATAMGDDAYAEKCRAWFSDGSKAMEEEMWANGYYLNYYEKETGKKSDDVMGYQLDGEWAARYHGLPGVFRTDRVKTVLETIRRTNIALTPEVGAANFARPDGSPLSVDSKVAAYGLYAMFPPELLVLAMTFIYAGEEQFGIDLAYKHWKTLCLQQGHIWDLPNIVHGDNGKRVFGTDYYQNMMLWAMPAALAGEDIKTSTRPDSLVDRMIRAGRA